MRIKARHAVAIAGALTAMVLPGTAAHASELGHGGNTTIMNVGTGGCLSSVWDDVNGGYLIRVQECTDSWSQVWQTEDLAKDGEGNVYFKVHRHGDQCLELIGDDAPDNGRLALRDCADDAALQVFKASPVGWGAPVWRVTGQSSRSLLRVYTEDEAPYTTDEPDWPDRFAEWQTGIRG